MSASSKKKLRKEQNAAAMTERQRAEKAEAKKVKAYTISFVAIMVVLVIVAVSAVGINSYKTSGKVERNTIAATVAGHELNSVEMNYYYMDAVNDFYSDWYSYYGTSTSTYLSMMGLDTTTALDEQEYYDGVTWADYFYEAAMSNALSDYALYDAAMKEGFTLSEEEKASLDSDLATAKLYAMLYYGYSDFEDYLVAYYGYGSTEESYVAYNERTATAIAYYNAYGDSLTYDDAAIQAYEAENFDNYSSFSYAVYSMSYSSFLTGGTEDEEGKVTYSSEDYEAARAALKAAAESLTAATTADELDAAIAALEINAESENAASTKYDSTLYANVSTSYVEWLAEEGRQVNDIAAIPYETTTTDADGNETTVANTYYVVMFLGRNDNHRLESSVRHLLVKFEEDEEGNVTDEAKAAAKEEAEGYYTAWRNGDANEESFIAMVQEYSDDSSAEDGGLFEVMYGRDASTYLEEFYNWSVDADRKAGDGAVIETDAGYHVMYYVGDGEQSYRDYMIDSDMRSEDLSAWYTEVLGELTYTAGDTSYVNLGLVLTSG